MLKSGIYLMDYDGQEVFSGIDPESLSDAHPGWRKDVSALGPWDRMPLPENKQGQKIWSADGYKGSSPIWITGTATSSMDVARLLIRQNLMTPWSSVLAVRQTAGRGQRQREWISPSGNIYGTWLWPFNKTSNESLARYKPMASLLAGDILSSIFLDMGIDLRIKWPNDLLLDNRKLCGILVEDRGGHLLVGMGINLVTAPEKTSLRDEFVLPATCLDSGGTAFTPLAIWSKLMESGKKRFEDITQTMDPDFFLEQLETRMAWVGTGILIREEGKTPFEARLSGIAADGGLKILRNGKREVIYSGTIRPL